MRPIPNAAAAAVAILVLTGVVALVPFARPDRARPGADPGPDDVFAVEGLPGRVGAMAEGEAFSGLERDAAGLRAASERATSSTRDERAGRVPALAGNPMGSAAGVALSSAGGDGLSATGSGPADLGRVDNNGTAGNTRTEPFILAPVHREMVARLRSGTRERRGADPLEVGPPPAICFAPGTDESLMDAIRQASWDGFVRDMGDDAFAVQAFQLGSRWTMTATNRTETLGFGDPITLTWGFVRDGVNIPGGSSGSGEPSSPSNLINWLNQNFGSTAGSTDPRDQPWFALFEQTFQRWSDATGVRYVYEPGDDGASFPSSRGVAGVRADVRIAGHRIDGFGNTLAYNFFPNGGDMVLDTDDSFLTVATSNFLRLRNVVAHEHGHGLGLEHVCPLNQTKLMEGRLSLNFDGPQFDDIYSANRHYGDRLEDTNADNRSDDNDDDSRAAQLGTLAYGTQTLANLSIDDNSDVDYLELQLPDASARLGVTVRPEGSTYQEGAQASDGSCGATPPFDFRSVHDLSLEIIGGNGRNVLASANFAGAGAPESLTNLELGGSGPFFIRVTGGSTNEAQIYSLDLAVSPSIIPELTVDDAETEEGAGALVFTIRLSPAPLVAASVDYEAVSGTASEGQDFGSTSGTLVFNPGEVEKSISVPLIADLRDEPDETFAVEFSGAELLTLSRPNATGTIRDDDPAPLITTAGTTVSESATGVGIALQLSAPSDRQITVDYTPIDESAVRGFDYNTTAGTVTFEPGQTSRSIGALVINDQLDENDETFRFELGNATNATIGTPSATITIIDNDPLPVLSITGLESGEADGSGDFLVTLAPVSGRVVEVRYATAAGTAVSGSDFLPAEGILTFFPGDTTLPIPADLLDDLLDEDDETFSLLLEAPTNATLAPAAGSAVGVIIDDDPEPALTVSEPAASEEADALVFELHLSSPSGRTISLDWTAAEDTATAGLDFDPVSGKVEIPPGDVSAEVRVPLLGDELPETNESILLLLSTPVHIGIAATAPAGRILDDDALPAARESLSLETPLSAAEGPPILRFDAVPGRRYLVEMSTDLIEWSPLNGGAPLVADESSESIEDTEAIISGTRQRFYRLRDGEGDSR